MSISFARPGPNSPQLENRSNQPYPSNTKAIGAMGLQRGCAALGRAQFRVSVRTFICNENNWSTLFSCCEEGGPRLAQMIGISGRDFDSMPWERKCGGIVLAIKSLTLLNRNGDRHRRRGLRGRPSRLGNLLQQVSKLLHQAFQASSTSLPSFFNKLSKLLQQACQAS